MIIHVHTSPFTFTPHRPNAGVAAPAQQLFDAGFKSAPVSGLPVFDPRACTPALLESVWRSYCGVADTINTKELGGTKWLP